MEARVVGVNDDDMGDGSMQCSNHPYRNNPGGICAFCLQEKLGKLVSSSSSFPLPVHGSSASSSSPPFRSDATVGGGVGGVASNIGNGGSLSLSLSVRPTSTSNTSSRTRNGHGNGNDEYCYTSRRVRIPFLLAKKKKKAMVASSSASASDRAADIVFKRSKSTTTPRRSHGHFLEADNQGISPRKRGFWSFLYHSSSKNKVDKITTLATTTTNGVSSSSSSHGRSSLSTKNTNIVIEEEEEEDVDGEDEDNGGHHQASGSSLDRKVSRSRSVGCGSRSFSGDFFERISTGFGDCTLRRVESQREGKPKFPNKNANASSHHHHHQMKERVKCGGLFSGFIITSSSSSSSSSSYWVSSSSADQDHHHHHHHHVNGKSLAHARSRSWGWAFASPLRAFGSKPSSSKDGTKRSSDHNNKNTTTPNLAAIPSLLAVRS